MAFIVKKEDNLHKLNLCAVCDGMHCNKKKDEFFEMKIHVVCERVSGHYKALKVISCT